MSAPLLVSINPADGSQLDPGQAGAGMAVVAVLQDAGSGVSLVPGATTLTLQGPQGQVSGALTLADLGGGLAELRLAALAALPEGTYTVRIRACDNAGNCASTTKQFRVGPPEGPNEVKEVVAVPNPNPKEFLIRLAGAAEAVQVEIYTKAMAQIAVLRGPGCDGPGWVRLAIPDSVLAGMGNDLYYAVAAGLRGGQPGVAKKGKIAVLR